ncbi:MAG TPA: 1-deoxy-D-xylulose-5-phosphate synthase, partial [Campylobacterales bacterium]|nr:1-deoxy-D-xylulose-5-phosphate synthase [Campylobacterales bacterium]
FAIDRAGIVGEDGETHQGVFDISYLRPIPNMTLFAPRDEKSLERAVEFAYSFKTPCAFRYPRGNFILEEEFEDCAFEIGKSQLLIEKDSNILFVGYGNGVGRAYETMNYLDFDISLLDLRFVKPLDENRLVELSKRYKKWFIFSDSVKFGGVASAIGELFFKKGIKDIDLKTFEFDDRFIPHGKIEDVEKFLGLLPDQLARIVKEHLEKRV